MSVKTYTADRHGQTYMNTPSWEEFKAWMHKNNAHLDKFTFYTSDYDGGCLVDCDCSPSCVDYGFTPEEEDQLEEEFGVLV